MARGRKTGGRKPGSINKTTAEVKAALVKAFDELGGIPSLVEWGRKAPGEFYKLWVKMLPTEIKNADGGVFRVGIVEEIIDALPDSNGEAAPDSA